MFTATSPVRSRPTRPVLARLSAVSCLAAALLLCVAPPTRAADAPPPTLFGTTVQQQAGMTWTQTIQNLDNLFGNLQVIRLFNKAPANWTPAKFAYTFSQSDGVVSFDVPPADVLTGMYDSAFLAFFQSAPTTRRTWWSYFHEPDVAYTHGRLTDLAQYRSAFRHVALLARQAGNPMLQTTLILVGYSGNPKSGQSITDYWPGADLTDTIAWDVFNGWATRRGSYGGLTQITDDRDASVAVGKPWALAEFGSLLLPGDDGSGRGAWIRSISAFAHDNGAQFASYFDTNGGPSQADYRLLDAPSQEAWRYVVGGGAL